MIMLTLHVAIAAAFSSPTTLPAAHADAFTSTPYAGNPACVVLLPSKGFPNAGWMQKVANEMHLSETAFLVPLEEPGAYNLKWFTPTDEVDLCGHATLASSHVLWEVHEESAPTLKFHTLSGELLATRDDAGYIELDFPSSPAVPVATDDADRTQLLAAFPNLKPQDVLYVGRNDIGGPGGGDLMAEVTPEAFAALEYSASEVKKIVCRVLSVTAAGCPASPEPGREKAEYAFRRGFAPLVGVDEDPVCGSAHCMLAPYWTEKLGAETSMLARVSSPRGGDVRVRVEGARTKIAGKAVTTLKGSLLHVEG